MFVGQTPPPPRRTAGDVDQAAVASLSELSGDAPPSDPPRRRKPPDLTVSESQRQTATAGASGSVAGRRPGGGTAVHVPHRPVAQRLWRVVAVLLGVRQQAAVTRRRSKWRWVAVGLAAVAALAVVGAASTPWINGRPLVVDSAAAHRLSAYQQAVDDQAKLVDDVQAAQNAGLDITTITGAEASAQGLCASMTSAAQGDVDQKLFGALAAECTAAVGLSGYLADAARAAGAAPSQLVGAEKTFADDYKMVQQRLEEAKP